MVMLDSKIDPLPNKAISIGGMIIGTATTIFDPLDSVCLSKSQETECSRRFGADAVEIDIRDRLTTPGPW